MTRLRLGAEKVSQDTFVMRLSVPREDESRAWTTLEMEIDPALRRSNMTIRLPIRQPGHIQWIEMRTVDKESWIRFFGFGEPPKGWLPADPTALLDGDNSFFDGTQATKDLQELVRTVVEPRLVTERVVSGTLDLHRHPYVFAELGRSAPTTDLSVPFTVTLDPQGRITNLTIFFDQTRRDAGRWQIVYHSFGKSLRIEPPSAGEVLQPGDVDPQLLSYLKGAATR